LPAPLPDDATPELSAPPTTPSTPASAGAGHGRRFRGRAPSRVSAGRGAEQALRARVAAPLVGSSKVVVGGFGGGTGRTTVAAGVGMALAAARRDPIAAVDACAGPYGTLAARVGLPPDRPGIRDLVRNWSALYSLTDVRTFVAGGERVGVEVLDGVRDLAAAPLAADELRRAVGVLCRWYPLVVLDAPPGWTDPVAAVALSACDALVLVVRATPADLTTACDALTALTLRGQGELAAATAAAVVAPRPGRWPAATREAADRLAARVRELVPVPYDVQLADGEAFDFGALRPRTRRAFMRLAASAVDQCQRAHRYGLIERALAAAARPDPGPFG
jgi:MinD-like ATPase involved in chromosome partitioning or flagellar assembly